MCQSNRVDKISKRFGVEEMIKNSWLIVLRPKRDSSIYSYYETIALRTWLYRPRS